MAPRTRRISRTSPRCRRRSIPFRDGRAYMVRDPYGHDPLPALRLNPDGSADTFVPPALVFGLPLGDGTYLYQFKRFFADGTPDANFTFPFPPGYNGDFGT